MTKLLLGKEVNEAMLADLRRRVDSMKEKGKDPTLLVIRLGERPDDLAYERGLTKRAEALGVCARVMALDEKETQENLLAILGEANEAPDVDGILLLRPLPAHLDEEEIRNAIAPEKDVDGITDASQVGVYTGEDKGFGPCTAEACMAILRHYGIDVKGKEVAVIGRSQVIGRPVAMMLLKEHATVTICHTRTVDMPRICREKDILICAAGHIGTVTKDCLREGQTVIDVAINFDEEGKMKGDADFEAADGLVDAITPVPGGVGAVTTTILMEHVIRSAERSLQ